MQTGQGLLGVARQYGDTFQGASSLSQAQTANAQLPFMKMQRGFDVMSLFGQMAGGGQQLQSMFGGSPQMSSYVNQAPWAQYSGLKPVAPQFSWMR
jgi:hypothetical protein